MRQVIRKNGKIYEGLSLNGIANQIASSLRCFHENKGTSNDCQLTINPLVRAYHAMIIREWGIVLPATPLAKETRNKGKSAIREHRIPTHAVVCLLMYIDPKDDSETETFDIRVKKVLDSTFKMAWVVKDEHEKLNRKYMHSLPIDHESTLEELAIRRYKECDVPEPN
ncbi:hypothetical protein AAKU64_004222 [Undibacterium sp. GrIS 1.8]|uniref:hypothetical protein n=1 Tax=Undibacterium sp. GrIS 1.8 TaxID=3143934 RepID=UPI0033926AEB